MFYRQYHHLRNIFAGLRLGVWIGVSILLYLPSSAQIVDAVEYFFDTDPGYGNGIPIAITPAESLTLQLNLTSPVLSGGMHKLYIRARQNGVWGLPQVHRVWVERTALNRPNIARLEYFLDNDPGVEFANPLPYNGNDTTLQNLIIPLNHVTPGFHWLCFRAVDTYGAHSMPVVRPLWVEAVEYNRSQVVGAEVFFDSDPGAGNGLYYPFNPAADSLTAQFVANLSALSAGYHNMGVRIKDSAGKWSHPFMRQVLVLVPPDAPQFLVITYDLQNQRAILTWSQPNVPMDGFRIYRHTTGHFTPPSSGTLIATVSGNTFTYTDVGVTGQYFYRVTAFVNDSE
ncbi:MAG: hypothetical protein N2450_08155 [bacterium]|nr:hypothetical protein [bacterium]